MEQIKHPLPGRLYTYSEYFLWDTWDGLVEDRYELIYGVPYLLERSYSIIHQSICGNLLFQLANGEKDKIYQVLCAPLDVRLNPYAEDNIVVQPDIMVFLDDSKRSEACCVGAPDMVVEILSPVTARRDMTLKLQLYTNAGVREYWIVDPETETIYTYWLENGRYFIHASKDTNTVPVRILEDFTIDLSIVFEEWPAEWPR